MTNDYLEHVHDDDLVALALGLLAGERRAVALTHIDACPACSINLEELARAADGLLQMTPEIDPPVGFEVRVLDHMRAESPTRGVRTRRRIFLVATAAAILAVLLGFGAGRITTPTKTLGATSSNAWNAVYHAKLMSGTIDRGTVVFLDGPRPWVLIDLHSLTVGETVQCTVQLTNGKALLIGQYRLRSGGGSWGVPLTVAPKQVRDVVISSKGVVLARTTTLS